MDLKTFFTNLINGILDGSFERVRIINQMNDGFKEYFTTGEFDRLCKASISQGCQEYAHEMSALWFRSGFKITIENDINLHEFEIIELSKYITDNKTFVRQLLAMGFDTLIITGKTSGVTRKFELKRYADLKTYMLK